MQDTRDRRMGDTRASQAALTDATRDEPPPDEAAAAPSSAAGSSSAAAPMDTDAQVATVSSLLDVLPTMGYEDAQELLRKNGWSVEAAVSAHFAAFDRASAPPAPRGRQFRHTSHFGAMSSAIESTFQWDVGSLGTEETRAEQEAFRRRREEELAAEQQRNRFWNVAMCTRHA